MVGVDSLGPSTRTVQMERLQQTAEEVAELWCGLALLATVLLRLLGLRDAHVADARAARRPAGARAAGWPLSGAPGSE